MKQKVKRILALVLCTCIMCGILPGVAASAVETDNEGGIAIDLSIGTTKYGETTFTSFEDLKEIGKQTFTQWTGIYYTGTEPLVIEEDLALPAKLGIILSKVYGGSTEIKVPDGVNFTFDYIEADTISIEGFANANVIYANKKLNVTGSLRIDSTIGIRTNAALTGIENISYVDADSKLRWFYQIEDFATLKSVVAIANAATDPHWAYTIDCVGHYAINESMRIPENCNITFNNGNFIDLWGTGHKEVGWGDGCTGSITVAKGCTLDLDCYISIFVPVVVNGTIDNSNRMNIYSDEFDDFSTYQSQYGGLTITENGAYTGSGSILAYEPETSLSGLDLSEFDIEKSDSYWLLTKKDSAGDDPTDDPGEKPDVPTDTPDDSGEIGETTPMYRLYNPYTHEHLLTGSEDEKDQLVNIGWSLDGVAWNSPASGDPVYRLYNPYDDWHTYSMSQEEIDNLVSLGWQVDGAVCYSASKESGMPIYRLFNPYEQVNYHMLTASVEERDWLASLGWQPEGVAWYGMVK